MMHADYQLAYCLILYIFALAHTDRAFKNERLTPEYILRLRACTLYRSRGKARC